MLALSSNKTQHNEKPAKLRWAFLFLCGAINIRCGFDYSVFVRSSIGTGLNGLFARFGGTLLKKDYSLSVSAVAGAGVIPVSGTGY